MHVAIHTHPHNLTHYVHGCADDQALLLVNALASHLLLVDNRDVAEISRLQSWQVAELASPTVFCCVSCTVKLDVSVALA